MTTTPLLARFETTLANPLRIRDLPEPSVPPIPRQAGRVRDREIDRHTPQS